MMLDQALTFAQVVMIDVALSGDNAVVIAMAASGLPETQRRKAILCGMAGAVAMRVMFSMAAVSFLKYHAIIFIGGLLLFYIAWDMLKGIISSEDEDAEQRDSEAKSLGHAILIIIGADLSMSLDNVLAVAGAARLYPNIMIAGLTISIMFMGLAANWIGGLLKKWPWLSYAGLGLIVYVASKMIYDGTPAILELMQ